MACGVDRRLVRRIQRQSGMKLTARQRAVVQLLADGLTCRQIANRLSISRRTVERHIENISNHLPGDQPRIRRIIRHAAALTAA
jgi:DNA-binding NarL/FixJ family response regulator